MVQTGLTVLRLSRAQTVKPRHDLLCLLPLWVVGIAALLARLRTLTTCLVVGVLAAVTLALTAVIPLAPRVGWPLPDGHGALLLTLVNPGATSAAAAHGMAARLRHHARGHRLLAGPRAACSADARSTSPWPWHALASCRCRRSPAGSLSNASPMVQPFSMDAAISRAGSAPAPSAGMR